MTNHQLAKLVADGQVLPEFMPADLMTLHADLSTNQLVTNKVETGIQQKSIL